MANVIDGLIAKSDSVVLSKVSKKDLEDFTLYLNTNYHIRDNSYDCSEIADDFKDRISGGEAYVIEPERVNIETFNVIEWGRFNPVYNHYVFIKNGVVFDPRFYLHPVILPVYKEILSVINNGKNLKYRKE